MPAFFLYGISRCRRFGRHIVFTLTVDVRIRPSPSRYEIGQLPANVSVRHCSVVSKSYQRGRYLFKLWPLPLANLKSASAVINRSPAVRNVKISQIIEATTEEKEDLERNFVKH